MRRRTGGSLDARTKVAVMDLRDIKDVEGIRFGLALHVREVLYGNIDGGNRLDFTCISPAVNLAARLEKVAAEVGCTIVTSGAFASCVDSQKALLGLTSRKILPETKN